MPRRRAEDLELLLELLRLHPRHQVLLDDLAQREEVGDRGQALALAEAVPRLRHDAVERGELALELREELDVQDVVARPLDVRHLVGALQLNGGTGPRHAFVLEFDRGIEDDVTAEGRVQPFDRILQVLEFAGHQALPVTALASCASSRLPCATREGMQSLRCATSMGSSCGMCGHRGVGHLDVLASGARQTATYWGRHGRSGGHNSQLNPAALLTGRYGDRNARGGHALTCIVLQSPR
jgi:hypothetical protein